MQAPGGEEGSSEKTTVSVTGSQEDVARPDSHVVGSTGVASQQGERDAEKPSTEEQIDWSWGLFGWDDDPWTGHSSKSKGHPGVAVLDVTRQREVFNYLALSSDMIEDHLPDSYTRAIAELGRRGCVAKPCEKQSDWDDKGGVGK
jgi:hypothetical protein